MRYKEKLILNLLFMIFCSMINNDYFNINDMKITADAVGINSSSIKVL